VSVPDPEVGESCAGVDAMETLCARPRAWGGARAGQTLRSPLPSARRGASVNEGDEPEPLRPKPEV
jgi:hypothetical protein